METKLHLRNRNEVLLRNRIDNEFYRILLPLNILQQITFVQKYRIRDKFITSNDNITNIIAFCILICIIAFHSYQIMITKQGDTFSVLLQTSNNILELGFEPLVVLINFIYTVRYSNIHVTLLLKLQRLAKFTKYSKYKNFTARSWLEATGLLGYHLGLMLILYVTYSIFNFTLIFMILINSYIYYTSRLIDLLKKNLVLWTDNIKQLVETSRSKTEEENDIVHQTEYCVELFNYYKDILEAFRIVKKTFELLVLLNITDMFFRGLIHLQSFIELFNTISIDGTARASFAAIFLIWFLRSLVMQAIISTECEKFYLALEDAACICLTLKGETTSVDIRRMCKNVVRLRHSSFTKMDLLGFVVVDAKLTLTMIELFSTYIVVLLQFAFL